MQTPDAKFSRESPAVDDFDGGAAGHNGGEPAYRVPTHYQSQTGRILAIIAGAVALLLVAGFFIVHYRHAQAQSDLDRETKNAADAPPPVDVVPVRYAAGQEVLTLPGETAGWYQSTIYARVNGYLGKWYKNFGDKVKKGDVLATVETPELDARLVAAEAKLAAAEAQVDVNRANADFAQSTYQRWAGTKGGAVSVQETEEKRAEYKTSVAKLNASIAQVRLNEAEVNGLRALTAFKRVTAPYAGVVIARRIDIGDLVTAGSTANTTPMYTLAQSDWIRVYADVPQGAASEIVVGMPATATTSARAGRRFRGRITHTADAIDPVSRTLHVEVDIFNRDFALVPGMYVDVAFDLVHRPLLEVPASALVFRSAGPEVAIVGTDGRVQFQKVDIGRDDGDRVELSSGKVSNGDRVALNISSQITDGEVVNATEIKEAAPAAQAATGPSTAPSTQPSDEDLAPPPPPPPPPPYVVPGSEMPLTEPVTTQPMSPGPAIPSPAVPSTGPIAIPPPPAVPNSYQKQPGT